MDCWRLASDGQLLREGEKRAEASNERGRAVAGLIAKHRAPINRVMRKYGISTPFRQASFFGNSVQESTWLSDLQEGGGSMYWYAPWFGRGFLQLTHPENYIAYWEWRGRTINVALKTALLQVAKTEGAKSPAQRNKTSLLDANFPGMSQELIDWRADVDSAVRTGRENRGDALVAPSDSAGFYWARQMLAHADSTHILERVSAAAVDAAGNSAGQKVYYRSPTFWRVSASVNLPNKINNKSYAGINGFEARCSAYAVALATLTEMRFPDRGTGKLEYPENYTQTRMK